MFGSSGWLVSMVGDALSAGSGEAVASGGSDGVSKAAVFLVGGDVADAGVQSDGVVALSLDFEFGAEHVDVVDEFEVGLFGLEVAEQALDPGLVGGGCRAGRSGWRASTVP